MNSPKEWCQFEWENPLMSTGDFIAEIQKDAYNQAIEDSKLKIKYDFRETTVDTPTNNASYQSRSEMFMDFMSNYEDSINQLKIK